MNYQDFLDWLALFCPMFCWKSSTPKTCSDVKTLPLFHSISSAWLERKKHTPNTKKMKLRQAILSILKVTFANNCKAYIYIFLLQHSISFGRKRLFFGLRKLYSLQRWMIFLPRETFAPRKRDQLGSFPLGRADRLPTTMIQGCLLLNFGGCKGWGWDLPKSFQNVMEKSSWWLFLTTLHKYFIYSSDMFGSYSGWDTATTGIRNLIIIFTLFILLLEEDLLGNHHINPNVPRAPVWHMSSVQYYGNLRVAPWMPPTWVTLGGDTPRFPWQYVPRLESHGITISWYHLHCISKIHKMIAAVM